MKQFVKKTVCFLLPFFGWLAVVGWMDPYDYLDVSGTSFAPLKQEIAYKIHPTLYELLEYKHHMKHSIVLGDSRSRLLRADLLEKYSGREFSNLAYSGGSLQEMISTFWLVAGDSQLRDVYMGINFNLYNANYAHGDRVEEALTIMKNFVSYALSTYTIKSTFLMLGSVITGKEVKIGVPDLSKDAFWKYQLNNTAKVHYEKYAYPTGLFTELKAISMYCHARGIRLVFFIPPTHVDLQKQIEKYHLEAWQSKFKEDLTSLGDVLDFDFPTPLTLDKANFQDPFHLTDRANETFAAELFSTKGRKYATWRRCTMFETTPKTGWMAYTKNLPTVFNQ